MSALSPTLPAFALCLNALVWGTSWWPFRHLHGLGLHPLWATSMIYALSCAAIVALRPQAVKRLLRTPVLWAIALASGTTNAAFNWGVVEGDVVRVVLLFYLMPVWVVLLARMLLGERLRARAALRVALALAGAAIVLSPEGAGLPLPRALADWLGLLGGFAFALNNVLLRREAERASEDRALAMFAGGVLVAGLLAALLTATGRIDMPPPHAAEWSLVVLPLALLFLLANLALQYGASRLPAHVTAIIMLTEVLFASASALALGAAELGAPLLLGGMLIVLAASLSAFSAER